MATASTLAPSIAAAPAAFIVGVLAGFWLSSFYRIVKRRDADERDESSRKR